MQADQLVRGGLEWVVRVCFRCCFREAKRVENEYVGNNTNRGGRWSTCCWILDGWQTKTIKSSHTTTAHVHHTASVHACTYDTQVIHSVLEGTTITPPPPPTERKRKKMKTENNNWTWPCARILDLSIRIEALSGPFAAPTGETQNSQPQKAPTADSVRQNV